jgi:GMP synthase (glutamine-hydrolysing)
VRVYIEDYFTKWFEYPFRGVNLDNCQSESLSNEALSIAYLSPPTDRDYPGSIQQILQRSECPTPVAARFEPHEGRLPDTGDFDLVVVTGSTARIGDPKPWFDSLADYLLRAIRSETPTLGVCFGHQFLAHLFGGTVESLPHQQVTVSSIELTEAGRSDPLFRSLSNRFDSFVYHHDHVTELPADATCLARNETGVQAFRVNGRPVRGIQFHPEFTERMARGVGYEGPVPIDMSRRVYSNLIEAVEETPDISRGEA